MIFIFYRVESVIIVHESGVWGLVVFLVPIKIDHLMIFNCYFPPVFLWLNFY